MSIDFDITGNIEAIPQWFNSTHDKAILAAARSAINKTLISARKLSVKRMGITYRLRPSGYSRREVKSQMKLFKAKGGALHTIHGAIQYKGNPIPLLKFVSGKKEIIKQKGVKIKKRRKLKVEIKPGKKFLVKGGFIQKAQSRQVFKRGSNGFKTQAVASIAKVMMRKSNKEAVLKHVKRRFPEIFASQAQFRINKANEKMSRKPMKKL